MKPFRVRNAAFRRLNLLMLPLCLPLALLLRIVLRALKPWVHVRFVRWASQSLGIWAIPTEVYLCQRDAGMHPKRSLDLFYRYDRGASQLKFSVCRASAVCNRELDRMFRRHLRLRQGAQFLDYLNRLLPRGSEEFIFTMPVNYDRDGLFERFPAHLIFTEEQEAQGQSALRRMGIPEGAPFVCFHVRDSAYHARWRPGLELFYYGDRQLLDERDASIGNYLLAAERLTELGYFCIRMGKYVAEPIQTGNPRIIDYATRYRSDFMDLYLSARCAFFIGHNSGMTNLPILFRRPVAFANMAPLSEIIQASCPNSIFLPKRYYSGSLGRYLTLHEILSNRILLRFFMARHSHLPEIRDKLQMELHENTPEEITELALEMHERLQGTFQPSDEDEALQSGFLAIWRFYSGVVDPVHDLRSLRMGSHFLRSHKELLGLRGEVCLAV